MVAPTGVKSHQIWSVACKIVHSEYLWQVADLTQASRVASVRHPSFTIFYPTSRQESPDGDPSTGIQYKKSRSQWVT